MKNKITMLIGLLFVTVVATAAKIGDNSVQLGKKGSTLDKSIVFDTGDGTSNKKLILNHSTKQLSTTSNTVGIGDGAASNKAIVFDRGGSNAQIRWNESATALEFTKDGSTFKKFGSGSGSGGGGGFNVLTNAGFEDGSTANWTNSGGTYAEVTSGSNLLFEEKSVTFDASSTGQYVESDLYTVPVGLYGSTCEASINYKGGDTNLVLKVIDGTAATIATRTFEAASTDRRPFGVTFACPTSGTFKSRVESTADAAIVALDQMHLGEFSTFQVATPQFYGAAFHAATASCAWTTSATSLTAIAADNDCPVATVTGGVTAPATKIPGLVIQGPGDFLITMSGSRFETNNTTDGSMTFRLSNGTQNSSIAYATVIQLSTFTRTTTGDYTFTISLPSGSHELNLYADVVAGTATLQNNETALGGNGLTFNVYKFPTTHETAFKPETINWLVDVNIAGANPSLGISSVSSYTEIIDAGLTLTNNVGSLAAQIPCSTTNPPTGTTCSAGSESIGVSFNLPAAGAVEACVSFTHTINLNVVSAVNSIFQIVETPVNAQTISQQGKSRILSKFDITSGAGDDRSLGFPHQVCGVLQFTSAGQKVIRLMYEQDVSGTPVSSVIAADANASQGQKDIHWTIRPINQHVPAPVFLDLQPKVDGPASGSSMFSVQYNGVAQSMSREYENWVSSIVRNSTGNYTINFEVGAFTQIPNCFTTINDNTSVTSSVFGLTTSSATVETYVSTSGALVNSVFNFMCHAQK